MSDKPQAPLISIALCSYNGQAYLRPQIESLLAQDYPNFEIVVCDDGSSDQTLEIVEEFHSSRITIHQNPQNIGSNRNFDSAFGLCRGDFIAPCDQDDIWAPDKLSVLIKHIDNHLLVYCDSELIDRQGRRLGSRMSDRYHMYSGNDSRVFLLKNCVAGHALLFRRQLLEQARPIPEVGFYDWWLAYIAASLGSIRYVDQCLVQFRQHSSSQTNSARTRTRQSQKGSAKRTADQQAEWLNLLASIPQGDGAPLARELRLLWLARYEQYVCWKLALLLFRQRKAVLFIHTKPFERLTLIFGRFWGFKARRLLGSRRYSLDE